MKVIGRNLKSVGVFCEFQVLRFSAVVLPSKNEIYGFVYSISEESRFSLIMLSSKNIYFLVCVCAWLFSAMGFVVDGAAVAGCVLNSGCSFSV